MPHTTGTVSSAFGASGLMRTLVNWCTGSPGTPGLDWTIELDQNTQDEPVVTPTEPFGSTCKEVILSNTGISGSEQVLIGIREWQYTTESAYGWDLNGYLTYQTGQHWNVSKAIHEREAYDYTWEHYLDHPIVPINDDTMTYWFHSNEQRIVGVVKIGGRYMSFYLGFGRRFGNPSDYQYPLCIIGSTYSNVIWTSESTAIRFIINPYHAGGATTVTPDYVVAPDGTFKIDVGNINDYVRYQPLNYWNDIGQQTKSSNDLYPMTPCYLVGNIDKQVFMDLDGVYQISGTGLLPEDTVDVDGKRLRVFPDIYRANYNSYMAVIESTVYTTTTTTTTTVTTTTSTTVTTTTTTTTTT